MQLHIVGLGVAEQAHLSLDAQQVLAEADRVIGSERQLQVVEHLTGENPTFRLPKLAELKALICTYEKEGLQSVVILASGDPLYYGIGRWFSHTFPEQQLSFYPAVSSIQAACHRLGLALQDVEVLSLHGRPLEKIRTQLKRNRTLVVLTDKHSTPQVLAQECIAAGFQKSQLVVCERLGYGDEQMRRYRATELIANDTEFDPLHVTVIRVRGSGGVLPEFPGIADGNFVTDRPNGSGMITKREVRLAILSLMQVCRDDQVWDIGAGCGGVAVELAYWNPDSEIHAIEHHPARLRCLKANQDKFGVVGNLNIVEGRAPAALAHLPAPDKVFIGGSDGELETLLEQVWSQLPVNGVLVASAVTESTKQHLLGFYEARLKQGDSYSQTTQISVNRGDQLAGQLVYRPALPVTLFCFRKATVNEEAFDV
ncbi:precorrin-6y C5,15-methyltransferase (decarboxylating) subunit CbiE [Pontibacterium granulatum]|uniref:precorrin-6y C5,15-methyltransferase (decarboxylating) subunit CbiE n=1 Tax=Pontibacterium granulatum TaxID=2036029 RepID=UPI00249A60C0|nr:precorrin-6y C5,15-methyltransferase (decarboxylating) subunit CbiE [Pontibacterium granulatum]MDI3323977.1 precorrin-6y C5,15-methyltransferase (decarboxylating) subunit CbiE [Pontibacterium granulatum]